MDATTHTQQQPAKPAKPKKTKKTLTEEQKIAKEKAKRDRFIELCPKRVNNAIRQLNNVSRMGNKQVWSMTDAECEKIIAHIQDAFVRMRDSLRNTKKEAVGFSL